MSTEQSTVQHKENKVARKKVITPKQFDILEREYADDLMVEISIDAAHLEYIASLPMIRNITRFYDKPDKEQNFCHVWIDRRWDRKEAVKQLVARLEERFQVSVEG